MEEVDPATATILAAIIGAGTSIGTTAFNAANAPSAPKPPDPATISTNAINAETANRATATKEAAQFLPGIEANSPGVNPDYLKNASATFSGNANLAQSPEMQQLIAKFLGVDTGASSSFGGGSGFGGGGSNPFSPGLTNG